MILPRLAYLPLLALAVAASAIGRAADAPVRLFDSNTLDTWEHVLADPSVARDAVWTLRAGVLICTGAPIGVLYTRHDYTHFRFAVQYRWAAKPGNSGVLTRMTPNTGALPRACEVQLKHGNAGMVLGLRDFPITRGEQQRWTEVKTKDIGTLNIVNRMAGAEKPEGEWNLVEIEARGERYVVRMNGTTVNEVMGVAVSAGRIGLQSEGGEIHFRNAVLTPLAHD